MNSSRHSPDRRPDRSRSDAFTLIELLVVISIIAVLAGLVVGLAPMANRRMKEARIRAELAAMTSAIDSYKAKYGVYPPDNYDPIRKQSNPAQTSLFYELTGVLVDNQAGKLITVDDNLAIDPADFLRHFGREGVRNSIPRIPAPANAQVKLDREQKKSLLRREFKPSQFAELFRSKTTPGYTDLEVLAVGFSGDASGKKGNGIPWPGAIAPNLHPVPTNPGLNPWRYVSTSPTNNPERYDLWAELPSGKGDNVLVIGNW